MGIELEHHLRDYFSSFCQLKVFTFFHADTSSHPHPTESFSAFQHTLSTISMKGCIVTKSGFVTLINYFPNLTSLRLGGLRHRGEASRPLPFLGITSRGCSSTCGVFDSLALVSEFSKFAVRSDEVVVDAMIGPDPSWPEFLIRVVDAFGANAKHLRVLSIPKCMCSLLLSRFVDP